MSEIPAADEAGVWKARWERERVARLEAERIAEDATANALHDPLTGLANRTLFVDRVEVALDRAQRRDQTLAMLFVDVDRFKRINDSYGHDVGDEVLCEVTRRLLAAVRATDTVARFGGDEFAILLDPIAGAAEARALSERVLTAISATTIREGGREFFMTASVGYVVARPGDGSSARGLLRDADTAMYQSKASGRAQVLPFDGRLRRRQAERLRIESDLGRAIAADEFELFYQPIVPLASGRAPGTEALVRWNHPSLGLVAPNDFIGVAEDSGLIVPLGAWVLREACATHAAWANDLRPNGHLQGLADQVASSFVSINVSPIQLSQPGFAGRVHDVLGETGVDPESVCLEVTESSLINDGSIVAANLREIDRLGCRLAIDDFGTGYSALSYLRRFSVDVLKIDRSFVGDVGDSPEATALVEAILGMAKALGIITIAEGVETARQAQLLGDLGCDYAQGYHFGRPVPAHELGGTGTELIPGRAVATERSPA